MKKISVMIVLLFWSWSILFGSVDLEVETGVLVETTDGICVEIDGSLTESGEGYFKGKIASGSRTEMTSFAGLSLSAGMDGIIIRTTGAAYAKGNGELTNFKRYYELDNMGVNTVTADMQIAYISSEIHDERNGLTAPYYICRYVSSWTGYIDNGTAALQLSASDVQIPTGLSDWLLSDSSFVNLTGVETEPIDPLISSPTQYSLSQNYPNPFNPETTIQYKLPKMSNVSIEIYDILGQKIKIWEFPNQPAGYYTIHWNGNDDMGRIVSSGVYFLQMKASGYSELRKMTVIH